MKKSEFDNRRGGFLLFDGGFCCCPLLFLLPLAIVFQFLGGWFKVMMRAFTDKTPPVEDEEKPVL